jgi:WD40 repeat protein
VSLLFVKPVSPYKGLDTFEDSELDALLFFGRERESEVIVANLLASKLTVLYGPSGVGKSSILRAAVARRLRELVPDAEVHVLDEWTGGASLPAPEGEAFLILDQFEEYFLYNHDGGPLLEQLPELLARPSVHVLVSLREDALARLDTFQAPIPNVFANHLRLDHLDVAAARAAILGPLGRYNELVAADETADIDPALVEAVLEQVTAGEVDDAPTNGGGSRRIEAPYLQLVLERVWEEERASGSRKLRFGTLRRLGGARAIVRDHLQRALGALPPREAEIATNALKFLVTPSRSKISHSLGDLVGYTDESPVELQTVLETLASQRILRAVAADGEEGRYEIFHDVLAEPVLAWRRDFEAQAAVERTRAAAERRHRRLLAIAGVALALAGAMAALTVWAFTQRSDARKQTAVAREQRSLAQQRAKATTRALHQVAVQAALAKSGRREALRQRNIARVNSHEALRQRNIARVNSHEAQVEARRALAAKREALRQAAIAKSERARATGEATLAEQRRREALVQEANAKTQQVRAELSAIQAKAGELAATALAQINANPAASVANALATAALEPSRKAEAVLRQVVVSDRLRSVLRGGAAVHSAAFSPDGSRILLVAGKGGARLFRPDGAPIRRLGTESVIAGGFSPDGALVATAGPDGVRLWNARDGSLVRTLTGDAGASVAFSGDGSRVAAATDDLGRVWTVSGAPLAALPHDGALSSIRLDGTGDRAVTVAIDDAGRLQARIFTVATAALERLLPERGLTSATFSPDSQVVATTSNDKTARLWSVASGAELAKMTSDGHLLGVDFSRDGKLLVTTNEAGGAGVWDVPSGAQRVQLVGPTNKVESAVFSPDARFVVISSLDRTARVFRTADGLQVALLAGHSGAVFDAEFSPDGRRVVTAGEDGTARVWDPGVGDLLQPVGKHDGPAYVAHISPDDRLAVSAGADSTARIWRLGGGPSIVLHHGGPVRDAVFSHDGKLVLTASDDGTAAIWRASDGAHLRSISNGAPVDAARFSPDDAIVATAGADGTAALWRTSDGARLAVLAGHNGAVESLAFSRNGKLLATGDDNGTTRVWNVATGARRLELPGGGRVIALAFAPDGTRLAAAGTDGKGRLWSVLDGRSINVLSGHTAALTDIEYSNDGGKIVTSSDDTDARLWDGRTGAPLKILRGHFNPVQAASFSPNGRWIVTAGPFTAGIWSTATGRLYPPTGSSDPYLRGPTLPLTSAEFSRGGRRILVASQDGTVRTYVCQICGGLNDLRRLAHALLRGVG